MEKDEKILKIISKVRDSLKFLGGKFDCITGVNVPVEIKEYFPGKSDPFGSFIDKVYVDKVEIMSLLTPRYSMWDTPAHSYTISYSNLTPEDVDKLYKELIKN